MFWQKFVSLCNAKGLSPNGVCSELGLSNATATKWKNGSTPRGSTLKKIADFFGVTTDDLLGNEKKEPAISPAPNLSPEEALLLQQWRNHPDAQPFVRKLLDMPEPTAEDGAVS